MTSIRFKFLVITASLLALVASVKAQTIPAQLTPATTPPAQTVPGFFSQATDWFTSTDTNNTQFQSTKGRIWTGAEYQSGLNIASTFGAEYSISGNWRVISLTENASVAGLIVGQKLGIGYDVVRTAGIELTPYAQGGYRWATADIKAGMVGTVGVEIKKALGTRTFTGAGISADISSKQVTPKVTVFAGFSF